MKIMTKKNLDKLMKEYDWDKNSIDNTIYFLDYVYHIYLDLQKLEKSKYEKYIKKLAKEV